MATRNIKHIKDDIYIAACTIMQNAERCRSCSRILRRFHIKEQRFQSLLYNYEDVENLQRMKELLYATYYIPTSIEDECTLQLTQADKDKFKTRK